MKKLLVIAIVGSLLGFVNSVRAETGSDLEVSGNVTTVTGYQRQIKGAPFAGQPEGILNDGLAQPGGQNTNTFGFFLDQAEVDLAKNFGENIRMRTDLDFSPNRADAGPGGLYVEQAYTTANIPVGNGVELLMGRFNSGIGLDPVDRNELSTVSFSTLHRTLLPSNLTGARVGYDVSEQTRYEIFAVNSLADGTLNGNTTALKTGIPAAGSNISYAWGQEGNKSWIKFNGAAGPEHVSTAAFGSTKRHWSFLGDLNGNFAVGDSFWVGAEGLYRQDDNILAGASNNKFLGGQLKGKFAFSDVWDGTLRYSYILDKDNGDVVFPNAVRAAYGATDGLGQRGQLHTFSLATGYQITEGARFVLEGSMDMSRPSVGQTAYTPGMAGMFAYSF